MYFVSTHQRSLFVRITLLSGSTSIASNQTDRRMAFVSDINTCSELATLGQGQQVHAKVIKTGADESVSIRSSLVSMYSRCGCLEDSAKVFIEIEDDDSALWSSMITTYDFHGHGHKAVKLFERMDTKGIEPNDVIFLSLLYACSHSGLREVGIEYFKVMVDKYTLKPRLEHYNCMVDLLGRSGYLKEAEALIKSMPITRCDYLEDFVIYL